MSHVAPMRDSCSTFSFTLRHFPPIASLSSRPIPDARRRTTIVLFFLGAAVPLMCRCAENREDTGCSSLLVCLLTLLLLAPTTARLLRRHRRYTCHVVV